MSPPVPLPGLDGQGGPAQPPGQPVRLQQLPSPGTCSIDHDGTGDRLVFQAVWHVDLGGHRWGVTGARGSGALLGSWGVAHTLTWTYLMRADDGAGGIMWLAEVTKAGGFWGQVGGPGGGRGGILAVHPHPSPRTSPEQLWTPMDVALCRKALRRVQGSNQPSSSRPGWGNTWGGTTA